MCRHVDFIAVFVITLGLLALSRASLIALPLPVNVVGFENVTHRDEPCQILSRLFDFRP
jgi:hypothetical protein